MIELSAEQNCVPEPVAAYHSHRHMGTWSYDVESDKMLWSDSIYELYDVEKSFVPTLETMLNLSGHGDCSIGEAVESAISDGSGFNIRFPVLSKCGNMRWLQANGCVYVDEGEPKRVLGTCRDVTALVNETSGCSLAGEAANENLVMDFTCLDSLLHRAEIVSAASNGEYAMFCFSRITGVTSCDDALDGEVLINDLKDRLARILHGIGSLVQVDGDTLVVIAETVCGGDQAAELCGRLNAVFDQPIEMLNREIAVSYHLDVFRGPGEQVEFASPDWNNRVKPAEKTRTAIASRNSRMADEIDKALESDEFVVAYQPKIDFREGTVAGYEALVRWQHPVKGLLAPSAFRHAFDDPDLENAISNLTLDKVVHQLAAWGEGGVDFKHVAVNVAGGQLLESGFFERFMKMTEEHAILPSQLKMEIREDVLLSDDDSRMLKTLSWFKQAGFGTAFDDFGRGRAGWKDIVDLSIDRLKIDRTLITNLLDDGNKQSLVRSIIELAHDLDLEVIAEGIETASVDRALRKWGCDIGQGFAYARPMLAEAIPAFISQWAHRQNGSRHLYLISEQPCG